MTAKKLVFAALLAVMSLTLYVIEGMIPPVVPIPGFSRCISAGIGANTIPH